MMHQAMTAGPRLAPTLVRSGRRADGLLFTSFTSLASHARILSLSEFIDVESCYEQLVSLTATVSGRGEVVRRFKAPGGAVMIGVVSSREKTKSRK